MLGVFAEFERSIIQERVRAGLARAKDEGKVLGRPKIAADVETAVRATLASGIGMMKAAKMHGVGVGTVVRISRAKALLRNRIREKQISFFLSLPRLLQSSKQKERPQARHAQAAVETSELS